MTTTVDQTQFVIDDVGAPMTATIIDPETNAALDISNATTTDYRVRKPDQTTATWAAAFVTDGSDGKITYSTKPGDLDQAGTWLLEGHIISPVSLQLPPSAIYDDSNYTTATLSAINDDPFAPDATFVDPDGGGDGQVGVDFNTSGVVGALLGTQQFAVFARGESAGVQSPVLEIQVFEGAALVISSLAMFVDNPTGKLLTFDWDGALITDVTQVRCLMKFTESGIGNQADLGAVAWVASSAAQDFRTVTQPQFRVRGKI